MKHLFIIGNGFDCYAHNLPTKYADFRSYILSEFPDAESYCGMIPESILLPDGGETMDMEEVSGYILRIIDNCGGDEWSNLEYYLGATIFDYLHDDLDSVIWDDSDKEIRHAVYNNEDRSFNIRQTFDCIKELFCEWVNDNLSKIDYRCVKKGNIAKILKTGDAFLNFNYTMTLENAYGIVSDQICHIHGKVGDDPNSIFFGHGDNESAPEWKDSLGADYNLSVMKRNLLKDTRGAFDLHSDFFNNMNSIETIHSFGFGFADVDMFYIEEISKRVNLSKTIWYLNSFDSNDSDKISKLSNLGFHIETDKRW